MTSESNTPEPELFDLDVLRGWKEEREPAIPQKHKMPILAYLRLRGDDGEVRQTYLVQGPQVYVGRYHPQNGPVDIVFSGLGDHEIYRLSAPHIRVDMSETGKWTVRSMTPSAGTELNGNHLADFREAYPLHSGDVLTLGCLDFEFDATGVTYDTWLSAKSKLLTSVESTALFHVEAGGPSGPFHVCDKGKANVVGRSFPTDAEQDRGPWVGHEQPDWNLAGLSEHDRKFIGFRHAALVHDDGQWFIDPLSKRQRTYVNRVEITDRTPLMPGDEVGLGSVLFHFHDPSDVHRSTHSHTAELPSVHSWREEGTSPSLPSISRETGEANELGNANTEDPSEGEEAES